MAEEKVTLKELDLFSLTLSSEDIEREKVTNRPTAAIIANGASATINNRMMYPPVMQPECAQCTPPKWPSCECAQASSVGRPTTHLARRHTHPSRGTRTVKTYLARVSKQISHNGMDPFDLSKFDHKKRWGTFSE